MAVIPWVMSCYENHMTTHVVTFWHMYVTSLTMTGLPRSGKNIWKMNFFQAREKSGNFVDGQGNLERTWKVREKSGNLKINGCGRQSLENLFCSRGERIYILM